ncbi:MAG: rod shape-determining protein RodA [Chloroflexi bacterium]|nr:rod shape-determining protein RodA [Chloroflexota bacterium]
MMPSVRPRAAWRLAWPLPRSDGWLWLAVALLVGAGLVLIQSATHADAPNSPVAPAAARQGAYAALGATAMLTLARLDARSFARWAAACYVLAALLLAVVLVVGVREHGARRWLDVGKLSVQPSEFAKLALVLALAAYASERRPHARAVAVSAAIATLPVALVALQPDLGTLLVLAATWVGVLVAWGVSWRVLGGGALAALALGPLLFATAVPDYQRERLAVFLDAERDPLGSGFNLRQVELALATAGSFGHGLFSGADTHLDAVAARASDFMFSFAGAELGFAGAAALLVLLTTVVLRGLRAARQAPDAFPRLLGAGLAAMLLAQAALNVAVNLRLFPATGVPLPFVSQGGSALVAMLLAVGVLQSVAAQRPPTTEERWR